MASVYGVRCSVRGEGGDSVRFKVEFPLHRGGRNYRAIREAILLDTTGNGYAERVLAAANRAKDAEQESFVSRSYGPAGRFSVWIVDEGSGERLERRKRLQAALGRVSV